MLIRTISWMNPAPAVNLLIQTGNTIKGSIKLSQSYDYLICHCTRWKRDQMKETAHQKKFKFWKKRACASEKQIIGPAIKIKWRLCSRINSCSIFNDLSLAIPLTFQDRPLRSIYFFCFWPTLEVFLVPLKEFLGGLPGFLVVLIASCKQFQ